MNETTGFDFEGHYKFGCSKSIIEDWHSGKYYIETVNVYPDGNTYSSLTSLTNGEDYLLKSSGTYNYGPGLKEGFSVDMRIPLKQK